MSILTGFHTPVRPDSRVPPWRRELQQAVRDVGELCRRLQLPPAAGDGCEEGAEQFPVLVPPSYLARIRPGDPRDPLLLQVLPAREESRQVPGFSCDPVGDAAASLQPGLLKKYAGRALLIATGACAVHCRYCFRRHFPYAEVPHHDAAWDRGLAAIADDRSIREVILSGGDPLMLSDERLVRLVDKIAAVRHVDRLRVHTRLPLMIPSRVTSQLVAWLAGSRLTPILVLHANHARELDDTVGQSLALLRRAGVMLLNQAVLLRGVNDTVEALVALSERLVDVGVVPYYLHQLDRVAGAAHFEVPLEEGRRLMREIRAQLPGYAVPRYVREIAQEPHKVVLS